MADEATKGFVDRVAGKAKEAVGSVVGSDSLKENGQLQQAEGEARRAAAELEKDATQREATAKADYEADRQVVQSQQAQVAQERAAREQQIERDKARVESKVDNAANQQRSEVSKETAQRERIIDKVEERVERDHAEAVDDVHRQREKASEARRDAADFDKAEEDLK